MKNKFMFTFLTAAMTLAPMAMAQTGDEQVVDLCQVQGRNPVSYTHLTLPTKA